MQRNYQVRARYQVRANALLQTERGYVFAGAGDCGICGVTGSLLCVRVRVCLCVCVYIFIDLYRFI